MDEGFSLSHMTVLELQQECKRRGLKKSGVKAKLIQRLAEFIEKYGLAATEATEKAVPVVETRVEKSVTTIANPHPYMEEYEESLIKGVEMEADVNNYFPSKKKETKNEVEANSEEYVDEAPDSDTPIPYPVVEDNDMMDDDAQQPGSPTYPATGNVRDARDEAEELTEPIHKSPTYCKSPNGRVVELPEESTVCEEEEEQTMQDANSDQEAEVEAEVVEEQDDDAGYSPTEEEATDKIRGDVNGALHDEEGSENEDNEEGEMAHSEEPEHFEEEQHENVDEETEYSERNEQEINEENNDENDEEEDGEEVNDGRQDIAEDNESDVEEENIEKGEDEDEEGEVQEDGTEEEEEEGPESGEITHEESGSIEDGEITLNVENESRDFDDGDDHLDVSVQDEKISDDHEMEEIVVPPKQPKKVVVPVTLKKRVSLTASTESLEERAAKRRRRWGSTSTTRKDSDVAISSESIKKLIPDMKIDAATLESVPELDYQEDEQEHSHEMGEENNGDIERDPDMASPPKIFKGARNVKVDSVKMITLDKPTNTDKDIVTVESESDAITPSTPAPPPVITSVRNYVIDDEVEVQEEREKSPSPAANPVSLYIHIENLVRPYTVSQLKSVIGRTGSIQDGGFWINGIKSKCYVKLSTEAEAAATRDALHGLRWPAGSPKLLKIDFAINEDMYRETTGLLGQKPKVVIEIEDKDSDQVVVTEERKRKDVKDPNNERKKKKVPPKEVTEKEKEKEKDKKDPEREESPAKLLDDLFRKTKATPCIYWLPLTEEQILKLEESRR